MHQPTFFSFSFFFSLTEVSGWHACIKRSTPQVSAQKEALFLFFNFLSMNGPAEIESTPADYDLIESDPVPDRTANGKQVDALRLNLPNSVEARQHLTFLELQRLERQCGSMWIDPEKYPEDLLLLIRDRIKTKQWRDRL